MSPLPGLDRLEGGPGVLRRILTSTWGIATLALLMALVSLAVSSVMGAAGLLILMIVFVGTTLYGAVSFRYIQIPVIVWLITLMGFRLIVFIPTPGLPDLTLDRIAVLWVIAIFLLKMVIERWRLKGPFLLDMLLLVHMTYLLGSVLLRNPLGMNSWTKAYLMSYLAYFLGKNLMSDIRWLRRAFWVLVVVSLYHSVTSIAEHYKIYQLVWPKWILNKEFGWYVEGRSRGVFLQPGVLGMCIGMLMGAQIYLFRNTRHNLLRVLLFVSMLVSMLGVFYTYTRGAWLVAFVVILVMGVVGVKRYSMILVGIVLAAVLATSSGLINLKQDRFFQERIGTEDTVAGRVGTLAAAVRIFSDSPVFGVGFFRYNEVKSEYKETIQVPFFGVIKRGDYINASLHDIYIGVLAEDGLVGATLQAWIYAMILLILYRLMRSETVDQHFKQNIVPMITGIVLGYFVGGATFDFRYFTTLMGLFYFFAGVASGFYGDSLKRKPSGDVMVTPRVVPELHRPAFLDHRRP